MFMVVKEVILREEEEMYHKVLVEIQSAMEVVWTRANILKYLHKEVPHKKLLELPIPLMTLILTQSLSM